MSKRKYNNVIIEPRDDIFEVLEEQMRKTPALLNTALKRQASKAKTRILGRLREEPGDPQHPIRWKTERQRRAYFATDGFGRGIGAPRTHALSEGWKVDIDGSNFFSMDVYNTQDYTRFVQGEDKQPFHIDTGWLDANPILRDESERFEDVVIETYFTVGDPTAGVF